MNDLEERFATALNEEAAESLRDVALELEDGVGAVVDYQMSLHRTGGMIQVRWTLDFNSDDTPDKNDTEDTKNAN